MLPPSQKFSEYNLYKINNNKKVRNARIWRHAIVESLDNSSNKYELKELSTDLRVIVMASRMALNLAKRGFEIKRQLITQEDIIKYARASLLNCSTMELLAVFLTSQNEIIAIESQGSGTIDDLVIYPREILKQCLKLSASNFYLIQLNPVASTNHWEGKYHSHADNIRVAGKNLGIELLDYFFVSPSEVKSLNQFHEKPLINSETDKQI